MTREESIIMKGVAIILMLFYHLFNRIDYVDMCQTIFFCGDIPLIYILTKAANPVSFFIMLSGYGLYISHVGGAYNVWRKIQKLYIHYWLTLLLFIPIGFFLIGSNKYPGSVLTIIGNMIGWNVSYNGEIWFLLPFAILMLCSRWIIKILEWLTPWISIPASFSISLGCGWLVSRINIIPVYILLLTGTFSFAFTLGVYLSKYNLIHIFSNLGGGEKIRVYQKNGDIYVGLS